MISSHVVIFGFMRCLPFFLVVSLLPCVPVITPAQTSASKDTPQLVVGRHTFFDFGPPFNYYDIFVVSQASGGSRVEKFTLTPEGNNCYAPAKVEVVTNTSPSSVTDLLSGLDLCKIPEKDLKKELKRKKHEMVFSGSDITLQVQCGSQPRTIRTDVLEKDWFAKNPGTPKNTSWTMQLLKKLDDISGPTVMDKPMFALSEEEGLPTPAGGDQAVQDLNRGNFDALFSGAPDKPSDLYHASLIKPTEPAVLLTDSSPVKPTTFTLPKYPRLPLLIGHEG